RRQHHAVGRDHGDGEENWRDTWRPRHTLRDAERVQRRRAVRDGGLEQDLHARLRDDKALPQRIRLPANSAIHVAGGGLRRRLGMRRRPLRLAPGRIGQRPAVARRARAPAWPALPWTLKYFGLSAAWRALRYAAR